MGHTKTLSTTLAAALLLTPAAAAAAYSTPGNSSGKGHKSSQHIDGELLTTQGKKPDNPSEEKRKKAKPVKPDPTPTPEPTPTPTPDPTPTPTPSGSSLAPFAPSSYLYQSLADAPVAPDSGPLISRLTASVNNHFGGIAAVNATKYNTSFYRSEPTTPRTTLSFNDCQNKGWLDPQFAAALKDVPIPAGAVPGVGSDANLTIYDETSDTLWEFWKAARTSDGWSACWGGVMTGVRANPGYFTGWNGASATGLAMAGYSIGVDEAKAGTINHAIGLIVMDAASGTHSWPAQRTDGHLTDADAMPEGRRLRLDPTLDVTSLGLTSFGEMVARAAQRYGFVVTDKGGAVAVVAESGAKEQAATGTNPWTTLFGDTPEYQQMKNFPWNKLQAMPHDYGKPTS